jgi:hypothetical protein
MQPRAAYFESYSRQDQYRYGRFPFLTGQRHKSSNKSDVSLHLIEGEGKVPKVSAAYCALMLNKRVMNWDI